MTAEVERVARIHGWTVYELNEEGPDGAPFVGIRYNYQDSMAYFSTQFRNLLQDDLF